MPSHLHLIGRASKSVGQAGQVSLSEIMRDFKKFTSKEIVKVVNRINESRREWMLEMFSQIADGLKLVKNYKVWQDGNHPELIFSADSNDRNWITFTTILLKLSLLMSLSIICTAAPGTIEPARRGYKKLNF